MRRHIPNTITCCNLLSGCVAATFAFEGMYLLAFVFIIAGAVFDFFDGLTARALKVSSPIGKELDSLADDVTFGVAPSAMVFYELCVIDYPSFAEPLREYIPYLAFLIAAFSALRLAKFNLDERQAMGFIGLPTPANALFWGSLLAGMPQLVEGSRYALAIMAVLIGLSCFLLVCELPMFALKFKQWGLKGNEVKYGFIVVSAALLCLAGPARGFWVVIVLYVLLSAILHITRKNQPQQQP